MINVSINIKNNQRFIKGEPQELAIKEANDRDIARRAFNNNGYYCFSWGRIGELLAGEFIIWEFYPKNRPFDPVDQFKLQQQFNHYHQEHYPHLFDASPLLVSTLFKGWRLYPGTQGAMFAVVATIMSEQEARQWVSENLLSNQELINKLQNMSV